MKKIYTIIILLILFVVGFAFYWYSYRPTKIKQQCSAEARFNHNVISESNDIKRQDFINMYYEDCLMRFGLK